MAFFMHTVFREENELDVQAVKADQAADFSAFAVVDPGLQGGEAGMSGDVRKRLKLAAAGAAALLVLVGGFGIWSAHQRSRMEATLEEARKVNETKDQELQKLAQEQWLADQKAQQLTYEAKEAKDAQARTDAQRALEQLQRDSEENRRRREELLKQKQVLQQKNPTLPKTKAPTAAPAATTAAPGQDAPPSLAKKAAPVAPHPNKSSLPASLQNSNINVTVRVFVDNQGRPLKVLVDKGVEGSFGYNEAAREAALGSTYNPAVKDGKPATGWVTLDYNFGKPQ
jgi:chemotaxis protein histidine kinase CheA